MKVALLSLALVASAVAQNIGTQKQNVILPLSYETCTGSEQCTQQSGGITLDSNWRWTHRTDSATNCYTGNAWDTSICSTPAACTSACAIDGVDNADWTGTYGVTASGSELSLKFVTQGPFSKNIGSRTYLTEAGGSRYRMFHLLNQEFTFDVDVSDLACGLNGALYFVEMEADGGMASHPTNRAGAAYGTGYCDAQCPHDVKWINGEANSQDWVPSATDPNSGKGHYGTCCQEMDIWEANSISQAYTTHPCATVGQERCEGVACGDNSSGDRYNGVCDKDGCDFASYRNFDHEFYGPGKTVDTNQKMTVVTQFITTDGTADGDLQEIRRVYVQNGVVIQNSKVEFDDASVAGLDSITEGFCDNIKTYFEDFNHHQQLGGLKEMGESLRRGHVLVLSLWADHDAHMLWLDSDYPVDADPTKPGVSRGTCDTSSGVPADVENQYPDATVRFSKIRVGDIGSTYPSTK